MVNAHEISFREKKQDKTVEQYTHDETSYL